MSEYQAEILGDEYYHAAAGNIKYMYESKISRNGGGRREAFEATPGSKSALYAQLSINYAVRLVCHTHCIYYNFK